MGTASVVAEAAKFCNFENEAFFCPASSKLMTERQKMRAKFGDRAHRLMTFLSKISHGEKEAKVVANRESLKLYNLFQGISMEISTIRK